MLKWDTDRDTQVSYAEFAAAFPSLSNVRLTMSPGEVHLSVVENGATMVGSRRARVAPNEPQVMWVTERNTTTSTVQYGTGFPANLSLSATGRCARCASPRR